MTQTEPGVYAGIPNAEYHGGLGISKSGLDIIARSPMHYQFSRQAANDSEPTAAMRIGTAAHTLILEPENFAAEYAVAPEGIDRRTKEGKQLWADFQAEADGKIVLKGEEMDQLEGMRDAVMAHPAAHQLLTGCAGAAELSAYWNDPETGALCRCRPDFWRTDGVLVDLKTTDDASPDGFAMSVQKFRYHVQAPFYLDGCRQAIEHGGEDLPITPGAPTAFVFIAVEKKPPHAVAVYALDFDSLEIGREEYQRDLQTYAECTAADNWPAYGEQIQRLGLPEWRLRREELKKQGAA